MKVMLLCLLTIVFVNACGDRSGEKYGGFEFKASSFASAPLRGGMMIYGRKNDGLFVAMPFSNHTDDKSYILPFGQWSFGVVGWDNALNQPLTGTIFCGKTENINLDPGLEVVQLNVATSGCFSTGLFDPSFNASGSTAPSRLTVVRCNDAQFGVVTQYASTCPAASSLGSFRLEVLPFGLTPPGQPFQFGQPFTSPCIMDPAFISNVATTSIVPPWGAIGQQKPFATRLVWWSSTDCAGAPLDSVFFPEGIHSVLDGPNHKVRANIPGAADARIFIRAP